MGEPGRHLRFREEPLFELAAGPLLGGKRQVDGLDRDRPTEHRVFGLVHDAHRPAAELAPDDVAPVPESRRWAWHDGDKCT
jgi:hypothetical protein